MSTAAERARSAAAGAVSPAPGAVSPAGSGGRDYGPAAAASAQRIARTGKATRPDRIGKTRSTIDLPHARHRALKRWAADAADELGVGSVPHNRVLELLVHQLLTDETTSRKVLAELKRQGVGE